jgi:gliding motility-associated-like protein
MDFEKGQQQNLFTYTYTTPGTFKLSVLYQSAGADDITITVDPDIKPEFEIYTCSGSKVSIKITDKTYDQYLIDFNNDGTADKTVPSGNTVIAQYDYLIPGNYNISVKGKKNNSAPNCSAMVKPFAALNILPLAQIKTLTAIDKTTLRLDFTPTSNIQYKVEIAVNGATNFQLYQTLYGVNTAVASTLDLEKNYYCFRLSAYDACTGANNYSLPVCSQIISLAIQSGVNKLSWLSDIAGVTGAEVTRNKSSIGFKPGTSSFYDDTNIECNKDYCYTISINYTSGAKSSSLETCGKSFVRVTPEPVLDVSTLTGSQGLSILWLPEPLQNLLLTPNLNSVLKSVNKAAYTSIGTVAGTSLSTTAKNPITFVDASYQPQENTCYRINYTDVCSNQSADGIEACALFLKGALDSKNAVALSFNDYSGWQSGVKNYTLEKFSATGALLKTVTLTTGSYVDAEQDAANQVLTYKITAQPNTAGIAPSTSNTITIIKETNLFYPNAFSPNGDNLNDTFIVSGQFIAKISLKVFDRWGSLLYATDKNEPWNGYAYGKLLSEGAYVWKVEITDFAGRNFNREGKVLLLTR